MEINELAIKGVFEVQLRPIQDHRGFFMRTYDSSIFIKLGLNREWVQENHSCSLKKGTIRGLHFQFAPNTESKLIRCIKGEIFDVAVDIRKSSPTFGKWVSLVLSEENRKCIFIPRGFAHGFCTLTDNCEVAYKVDNFYEKTCDSGLLWNDPAIGIEWPEKNPVLSEKDSSLSTLNEFAKLHEGL